MSVNRVTLIGNLCAAPELKFLASGQAVCDMRLATNEKWTDKSGQKQEKAEFHSIVVWGKTAENCAKFLDKGRQVYVEGKLQTRSWDDKTTGEKRWKTEIVAQNVTFLGGKSGREEAHDAPGMPEQPSEEPTSVDNSDIPF